MRGPKDYILIFIKGLCVGTLEVLHGISGSTVALMLGIYGEFINSLRAFDRKTLTLIRNKDFTAFWRRINGTFLLCFFGGITLALLVLTKIALNLQLNYFIPFTSFLFGFVLISAILLLRKVQRWSIRILVAVLIGGCISFLLTLLTPYYTAHNYFFVFVAGGLSSLSLIIPGVTGAFILVLIGKFQFILASFSTLNFGVIAVFCLGAAASLWVASRIMYKILADYYSTTVALLAGFMLGSLNRIWPWRKVLEYRTNSKGVQVPALDESILPWKFMTLTGKDPQVFQAIFMIALGVFIVVLIDKIAARLKTKI